MVYHNPILSSSKTGKSEGGAQKAFCENGRAHEQLPTLSSVLTNLVPSSDADDGHYYAIMPPEQRHSTTMTHTRCYLRKSWEKSCLLACLVWGECECWVIVVPMTLDKIDVFGEVA